jgi:protein phosphatase
MLTFFIGTCDKILLCSDGLTDLVENDEILEIVAASPPEAAATALVGLARSRGGHDNITLVIVEVPDAETASSGSRLSSGLRLALSAIALLLLVAIGLGLSYLLGFWPW